MGIIFTYQFVAYAQEISGQSMPAVGDSFEGNGTITTWYADQCTLQRPFPNPYPNAINPSANVLRYHDQGGQYANVRFDIPGNFPLNDHSRFRLKIYIPSNGTTGNQAPRISLKLQNNGSATPWSTQCEIIQPLGLNQWQEVQFDFRRDPWINLNPNSGSPLNRNDFNRVVLQVNGENNNDQVLAYLDDFVYDTLGYTSTSNTLVWSDEFETNGP
nr:beta-glucanase [Sphingomonadales bacterium]